MEQLKAFHMAVISAVLMVILGGNSAVTGQINTPCTTSMISSFTPCANLITGSTNNGAVPSSTCCESLRSLVNTSVDCACLVISASVPFQLPFSSTLALSLTRACNMNAVPAQCKASGSPLPAPGPAVIGRNGPRLGPTAAASPWSPQASEDKGEGKISRFGSRRLAQAQAQALLAPAPVEMEEPTTTPGIRPVFTPPSSSSNPLSLSFSPFMFSFISLSLLVATGF